MFIHEKGQKRGRQHENEAPVHENSQIHGREIRKAPKVSSQGTFGADILFTAA